MDRRLVALIASSTLLAVVVAVVLVARGGSDDGNSADLTDTSTKPVIEVPSDPPPTELVSEDIVPGDGPEAKAGDSVTVEYVGVLYDTGAEFDASWDREPFEFELGAGGVIPGWDEGVEGMREGGRRQLIIPPDLAYGAQGQPPDIPPESTLIFVIDLVSVG